MSGTHRLSPERSISLGSTATIAAKLLLVSTLAVIAFSLFSLRAHAQGSLPLGTTTTTNSPSSQCDPASGWFSYQSGGTTYYSNCTTVTVTCPNTASLNFTYSYLDPATIPGNTAPDNGLVVFFNGSGGTTPGGAGYDTTYFAAGYAIAQIAWADDWEQTYDPFPTPPPIIYGNIQSAACRPATAMNLIYSIFKQNVWSNNHRAGFCAQGTSAGSAQIAYPLAYYGAGAWLDNVELASGPVFSDVSQGCEWNPPAASVTVCGLNSGNQYGCQLGGGSTWTLAPTYLTGPNLSVGTWTNDLTCANANGQNLQTSPASIQRWLAQSIVDQGAGATPTFTYSSTGMSAWLCRSVINTGPNGLRFDCAAVNNNNGNYCPNNSSPQGQIFYENILSGNSPPHYAVYAVDDCTGAEGVDGNWSNVPGFYATDFGGTAQGGGTIKGSAAIQDDMIGTQTANGPIPAECFYRH